MIFISGKISPTIENLRITNGDADYQDGSNSWYDGGGGIYIPGSNATIRNNHILTIFPAMVMNKAMAAVSIYGITPPH